MKIKTVLIDEKKCIGCGLCALKCPQKCIDMIQNHKGFNYPKINDDLCINCNLCKHICPINNENDKKPIYLKHKDENVNVYVAISNNEEIRLKSSSGGIFYWIASYILENDGIVVGPVIKNLTHIEHQIINDKSDLELLLGSKYIQSDITSVLPKVKKYLCANNKPVLFSGTPCQIAALRKYLQIEYDNLYCQDVVCHGVPSNLVYVKYLQDTGNIENNKINFRDKRNGWLNYGISISDCNGEEKYYSEKRNDLFMKLFLNDIILRDCCYGCEYKGNNIQSDLTLGDFWGINHVNTKELFKDDKGSSVVIVRTDKGRNLFNDISNHITTEQIDIGEVIKYNSALVSSPKYNKKKIEFFYNNIDKLDIMDLTNKTLHENEIISIFKKIKEDVMWEIKKLK